ncbi:MAG: AmmeMemoRadiSam system radical SAM enzyme [Candidatus Margulisiibacteriota bacterium]|jgi:pyruvate formate lyase activating enzyme
MKKEALFWEKKDNGSVRCTLCPRYCVIAPGHKGHCQVRGNENGTLFSLVYGDCSAIAVDPIEKKPLRQFHPGTHVFSVSTVGCNLDCKHCQNWHLSHSGLDRKMEFLSPLNLVDMAKKYNSQGIAWTYNEPTIWFEYTYDSAIIAKEQGLYTVYVTNGYINEEPLDMIGPYLDAYCVDLKGFSDKFFREICGIPSAEPILKAIKRAKDKWNMHVEIVTNVIPGHNDDEEQLKGIAEWIKANLGADTVWELTRFFPNYKLANLEETPLATLQKAREIGLTAGLTNVFLGNVR